MNQRPVNEATASLIYEHTRGDPLRQMKSLDALDAKAVQIFAAASVVLGFGTFSAPTLRGLPAVLYGVAAVAYLVAGAKTLAILNTRSFGVVDGADRWWPGHGYANTAKVREQLLDDLASAFATNRAQIAAKGKPLAALLVATGVETLFVAAAVIASAY